MTVATTGLSDTIVNFAPPTPCGPGGDGLASGFDHGSAGWNRVTDQLLDIRGLVRGWDGDDAPAPKTALTDSALRLVAQLRRSDCPPPARAVASFDGTVVVEWQWPGVMIQLEVTGPGRADGTFHRRGHPTKLLSVGW